MAFLKVINNSIIMVAMLLPEFVQSITFSLLDNQLAVTDFESFLFESFDDFGFGIFLIEGKVTFSFVESNIR